VLPKVKAYHDSIGVPFGHWQFDSWFYPKDGGVNPGGGGGAVTNWTADPSIFPHGMAYIQSKLGLPTVMHNRQWSTKSDYIHNLSQFEWYTSKYAVPKDPIAFFDWFFKQQVRCWPAAPRWTATALRPDEPGRAYWPTLGRAALWCGRTAGGSPCTSRIGCALSTRA
jgi:hypothetical protein